MLHVDFNKYKILLKLHILNNMATALTLSHLSQHKVNVLQIKRLFINRNYFISIPSVQNILELGIFHLTKEICLFLLYYRI